jgi:hypothetical protein
VYVYRDTSERPGGEAAASPDEHDAAYWYDDLSAATNAHVPEETRGPFEPLVSSADLLGTPLDPLGTPLDPLGAAPGPPPAFGVAGSAAAPADPRASAAPEAVPEAGEGQEDSAYDRARKLEQIKDLYLTAEAIGEDNVDKHFDQLLTQQRELISEYFRRSGGAGRAAAEPGQPGDGDPIAPGPITGPADSPEDAGVTAEHPRRW